MPQLPDITPPGPQEPDVLARAKAAYPFINKFNPAVSVNYNHRNPDGYIAETFLPGDPGYAEYPRPNSGSPDSTVVEVYRPDKFSEHDLAAEFLHGDPVANEARAELLKTLTPRQFKMLESEPDFAQPKTGEKLPIEKRMNNITDALMRGYTVGQWPQKALDGMGFSDKQKSILDGLKEYTTTGGEGQ